MQPKVPQTLSQDSVTAKTGLLSEVQKLLLHEQDERYRYLLNCGVVRRIEDDGKMIYAELPQIPGVMVVYRKPSER
jgi:leucine-rich repeat-containing protein 49